MVRSPLRSLLTVFGVAIGVATLVAVMALNRSVMDAFRSTVDTIAGKADLTVSGTAAGFDDTLVDTVRAVPGVAHASGGVSAVAPVVGAKGESLYVLGVDLLDDGHFRTYEGVDRDVGALADDLEFLNSTERMLVSERFAARRGLKPNDSLELLTPDGVKTFIVHALVRETGPVKAFGGHMAVMYVGAAQEAFGRGRTLDRVDVAVAKGADVEQVRSALMSALGPTFEVERPSRRGGSVEKMVRSFQMGLNLGSAVALLVGVFLVYNTVSIGVVQRRREIGTLRALGASRLRIRVLFTLEALLMGTLGTCIGIPFGVWAARIAISSVSDAISNIYVQVNVSDVQARPLELTLGVGLGLLGSALAALRPATHASRVQPVEALRRSVAAGVEPVSLRSAPTLAGLALLGLAYPASLIPAPVENLPVGGYLSVFAVLMGATLLSPWLLRRAQRVLQWPAEAALGISGRLAADNFARAPARTAVPVSALSIGVAMALCFSGFVGSFQKSSERWIEQAVPADLFVTSASKLGGTRNQPLDPALGDAFARIPGVKDVDRVRFFPTDVLGLRIYIISLTPEIYDQRGRPTYLEGARLTPEQRGQGWVTISENLMRRRDLHVGDRFDVNTPNGVKVLTVGAVIIDYTSDQGTIFMDRAEFLKAFGDERVDTFELYLEGPEHLEAVRKAITDGYGDRYGLYVLSNRELREEARTMVDNAFSVTYAMEVVAVLLALLGVVNTLLAAVLDRTREIGLLRAIGAARAHIVRLFTAEAALMGLSGGALGVAMGAVTGLIVTHVIGGQSTGWSFPYLFPWEAAAGLVTVASGCAVLAGIYPARRAAQLDVVEALAYE